MKKNSFDKETMKRLIVNGAIIGGSTLAVYVLQELSKADFGNMTGILVPAFAYLIKILEEYKRGEEANQ